MNDDGRKALRDGLLELLRVTRETMLQILAIMSEWLIEKVRRAFATDEFASQPE